MIIPADAWPYLLIQKGNLNKLTANREVWYWAYKADIEGIYNNVLPFLPDTCDTILDVGGGMGGIDILLSRHYNGAEVSILDGEADPPYVERHAKTFNNLEISGRFLAANGVTDFTPIPADKLPEPRPFDLIVSFGSWCFHYYPEAYLDWVKACCHPGTVLILELRKNRPEWSKTLLSNFMYVGTSLDELKFDRMVFKA